jgi:plastocyanin
MGSAAIASSPASASARSASIRTWRTHRLLQIHRLVVLLGAVALAVGVSASPAAADTTITIAGAPCSGFAYFCFEPSASAVADGAPVTWTNQSGTSHTVTRCTPSACAGVDGGTGTDAGFTSANVGAANGSTFSHTFQGAGTYTYYCQIHGYGLMHGTVTVQASTPATTTPRTTTTTVPSSHALSTAARRSSATPSTTVSGGSAAVALARTGPALAVPSILVLALLGLGLGALLIGAEDHRRRRRSSVRGDAK